MIPHYLQNQPSPIPDTFGDTLLRQGQITDIIWPEDPRSLNKRLTEYEVLIQHRDPGSDTGTGRIYRATRLNDLCGFRDRSRQRLRYAKADKEGRSKGSGVVVLCLNGEHAQAVILGGLRDERDTDVGWRDSGIVWDWEENGVTASINEAGEFAFKRGGPTDIDGKQEEGNVVEIRTDTGKLIVQPENGLQIGEGTEKLPKFSTYRQAEGAMHQNIQNTLLTMATALNSIAVLHLIPIIGPILATPAFGQLGTVMSTLAGFLATFEGQGEAYLSTKHTSD